MANAIVICGLTGLSQRRPCFTGRTCVELLGANRMPARRSETKIGLIGSALLLSMFSFQNEAHSNSIRRQSGTDATSSGANATRPVSFQYGQGGIYSQGRYAGSRHVGYAPARGRHGYAYQGSNLQCVPYARQV